MRGARHTPRRTVTALALAALLTAALILPTLPVAASDLTPRGLTTAVQQLLAALQPYLATAPVSTTLRPDDRGPSADPDGGDQPEQAPEGGNEPEPDRGASIDPNGGG